METMCDIEYKEWGSNMTCTAMWVLYEIKYGEWGSDMTLNILNGELTYHKMG